MGRIERYACVVVVTMNRKPKLSWFLTLILPVYYCIILMLFCVSIFCGLGLCFLAHRKLLCLIVQFNTTAIKVKIRSLTIRNNIHQVAYA